MKETLDEEYMTVPEAKELLADVEAEQAADPEAEMQYELARAIEHVNRFALLDPDEAHELVEELQEFDVVNEAVAHKIADLLPENRDELRAVYAQERYSVSGEELDELLDVVAQYA